MRDYGDFVAAFVERYQGAGRPRPALERAQPDRGVGRAPGRSAGYVELLKAGYLGARRADPTVRVLSGMLAPTLEPDRPRPGGAWTTCSTSTGCTSTARGPTSTSWPATPTGLHTGPEDRQVGPPYTNFPASS